MSTNIEDAFYNPAEFDKSIAGWGQENNQQMQQPKEDDRWWEKSPLDDSLREIKQKNEAKRAEKLKKAEREKQKEIKRGKKIAIKRMKALHKAKAKSMQNQIQAKNYSKSR
jgi:hypothetical protein